MKRFTAIGGLLFLAAVSNITWAETHVWLIGGGNTLANSQGQIEENVRWLQSGLTERGLSVRTYFTHGDGADDDVVFYAPAADRNPDHETIARVFHKGLAYAQVSKRNSLQQVDGSTEKTALIQALSQDFASVGPDDQVLLVYNGHGDIDSGDTRRNSLKLWNDTRLDIAELDSLLDQLPEQTRVSFVMTQCFSGSFASLVQESPFDSSPAAQSRCGFLAESDRREAEGCDLGINQSEFRDYTTYFFAALFGKDRLGNPINPEKTDRDGSGSVSFYEAHLYTLENAQSSDLSRSSSEVLLEQNQPWYTRWDSWQKPAQNQYAQIAQHVAKREALPSKGLQLVTNTFERRAVFLRLEQDAHALSQKIKQQQADLQDQLNLTTAELQSLSPDHHAALASRIRTLDDYQALVQLQSDMETLNAELLDANRRYVQALKILRMNRLARLSHWQITGQATDTQACESNRFLNN